MENKMKFKGLKLATALAVTTITAFANTNTADNFTHSEDSLFQNKVAAQIVEHRLVEAGTIAKLLEQPTRKAVHKNLGSTDNVRVSDDSETWFYGLEIPTAANTNQKCIVAIQFDVDDEENPAVADLIGFSNSDCENLVTQQFQKDHNQN